MNLVTDGIWIAALILAGVCIANWIWGGDDDDDLRAA